MTPGTYLRVASDHRVFTNAHARPNDCAGCNTSKGAHKNLVPNLCSGVNDGSWVNDRGGQLFVMQPPQLSHAGKVAVRITHHDARTARKRCLLELRVDNHASSR